MDTSRSSRLWLITLAVVVWNALGSLQAARADGAVEYLTQAVGRIGDIYERVNKKTSYGYNDGVCLFGGWINPRQFIGLNQGLNAGQDYFFVTAGDDDATDIDLVIYDPDGNKVAEDVDDEPIAALRFQPRQSGSYTIRVYLSGSKAQTSYCVLALLRKDGWNVPSDNLVKATSRCVGRCIRVVNEGYKAKFNNQPGQWSFFGSILNDQDEDRLSSITLGSGMRVLLAAGDDHTKNLDLYLYDSFGNVVKKDTDDDVNPLVAYRTAGNSLYGIKIRNERSNGAAFVCVAILRID